MARHNTQQLTPEYLRTREAAQTLAVSESQVRKWTREGKLRAIRIPGIRATRYATDEVMALAASWAK